MSLAEVIDTRALRYAVRGDVVQAEDWQAHIKQQGVVARCNRLLKRAEQEAEKIKEAAFSEGFAAGKAQVQQEMAEQLITLRQRGSAQAAQLSSQVRGLTLAILERVVPSIEIGDLVSSLVHEAIDAMENSQRLKVHVHPKARDRVQSELKTLRSTQPAIQSIEILADDLLGVDECLLQSELGEVRTSWAIHQAAIKKLLATTEFQP